MRVLKNHCTFDSKEIECRNIKTAKLYGNSSVITAKYSKKDAKSIRRILMFEYYSNATDKTLSGKYNLPEIDEENGRESGGAVPDTIRPN